MQVIDSYISTQDSRERSYEESELVLYKNLIMQEAGKLDEALQHLDAEEGYDLPHAACVPAVVGRLLHRCLRVSSCTNLARRYCLYGVATWWTACHGRRQERSCCCG